MSASPGAVDASLLSRALTAAVVAGVLEGGAAASLRIGAGGAVGALGAVATAGNDRAAADGPLALLVATEDGTPGPDLPRALAAIAARIGPRGTFALVASSETAAALVRLAARGASRAGHEGHEGHEGHARDDAWARAMEWARARTAAPVAPALSPERLEAIERAAVAAGLALVEPDVALHGAHLAKVKLPRSARARALLALTATGALARPLLFVASSRAPKGGLAKPRLDRLADAWVSRGAAFDALAAAGEAARGPSTLEHHALAALRDAAPDTALPFKDLLREARDRHARVATSDARHLAETLYRLSLDEIVGMSVLAPSTPLAIPRP